MDIRVKALVFSQAFWDRIIVLLGLRLSRFPRQKKSIFTSDQPFHPLCSRTPISPSCLQWPEPPTRLESFSALTWTSPKIAFIPDFSLIT